MHLAAVSLAAAPGLPHSVQQQLASRSAARPALAAAAAPASGGSGGGSGAPQRMDAARQAGRPAQVVWLSTTSQDAFTAALESGVNSLVFGEGQAALAREWQALGRFEAITRTADGRLLDAAGTQVGALAWAGPVRPCALPAATGHSSPAAGRPSPLAAVALTARRCCRWGGCSCCKAQTTCVLLSGKLRQQRGWW